MLIAFEGIDGSGKGTQSKAYESYLRAMGVSTELFSYPNYDGTFFGKEVAKYLNGSYGKLSELPAEFASLLFALDRFEMKNALSKALLDGKTIISDRYVASNFAYQAAKLPLDKQDDFIKWVEHVEYNILQLPKPDVTIFLDIPPKFTTDLVLKKEKRTYTNDKKDIHEKDDSYQMEVYCLYKRIANEQNWLVIDCCSGDSLKSQDDISEAIKHSLA